MRSTMDLSRLAFGKIDPALSNQWCMGDRGAPETWAGKLSKLLIYSRIVT